MDSRQVIFRNPYINKDKRGRQNSDKWHFCKANCLHKGEKRQCTLLSNAAPTLWCSIGIEKTINQLSAICLHLLWYVLYNIQNLLHASFLWTVEVIRIVCHVRPNRPLPASLSSLASMEASGHVFALDLPCPFQMDESRLFRLVLPAFPWTHLYLPFLPSLHLLAAPLCLFLQTGPAFSDAPSLQTPVGLL